MHADLLKTLIDARDGLKEYADAQENPFSATTWEAMKTYHQICKLIGYPQDA